MKWITVSILTMPTIILLFFYHDRGGIGINNSGMRVRRATLGATLRAQNASMPALRCVLNTIKSALPCSAALTMV